MSYINTFILVSQDCPVDTAEVPLPRGVSKPMHLIQYELLQEQPYQYDHEQLIFEVHLRHKDLQSLAADEKKALWEDMFSKGHPCMRASALVKRYGFGAHYNEAGKIAIYPVESAKYKMLAADENTKHHFGMKSKR